jgi:DNA-directed RNA polymerase subunit RPC12/RpoP
MKELGRTAVPPALAMKCGGCGHTWIHVLTSGPRPSQLCPTCNAELRDIGSSATGARYFRCVACASLVIERPMGT